MARIFLFTTLLLSILFAENPVVMTEIFPPYGYYEEGKLTGLGVEIVRLIMEELESEDTIQVYPWARAYNDIQTKENRILFLMARTSERESLFQWAGPIFRDSIFFYKRSDDTRSWETIEDLRSVKRILVNRGFPQQKKLEDLNFTNLYLTVNPEQDLKMMEAGRADLMIIGSAALGELLREENLSDSLLANTGVSLFATDLYVAFSKDMDPALVEQWNSALRKLKSQGKLTEILKRYIRDSDR